MHTISSNSYTPWYIGIYIHTPPQHLLLWYGFREKKKSYIYFLVWSRTGGKGACTSDKYLHCWECKFNQTRRKMSLLHTVVYSSKDFCCQVVRHRENIFSNGCHLYWCCECALESTDSTCVIWQRADLL